MMTHRDVGHHHANGLDFSGSPYSPIKLEGKMTALRITSVKGFTHQGTLTEIVCEGISDDCKKVIVTIRCSGSTQEEAVFIHSGKFIASFDKKKISLAE